MIHTNTYAAIPGMDFREIKKAASFQKAALNEWIRF